MNDGKNGRPPIYGSKVSMRGAIYKVGVGIAFRPLEEVIRIHAGGKRRTPLYCRSASAARHQDRVGRRGRGGARS